MSHKNKNYGHKAKTKIKRSKLKKPKKPNFWKKVLMLVRAGYAIDKAIDIVNGIFELLGNLPL